MRNILHLEILANARGEATERFGGHVAFVYRDNRLPAAKRVTEYFLNGLRVERFRLARVMADNAETV